MAWYRAGSVAVTNGSAVVTGTGTSFVANVQAGHAINLPDGRAYEVLSVDSNTQLTLGSAYLGGTAGGQSYSVQPNQGFAQTAATRLSEFLSQISVWVAGALAGRFGDGSLAAPGVSFSADQDTGVRRVGDNAMGVVCGGVDRLIAGAFGATVLGRITSSQADLVGVPAPSLGVLSPSSAYFGITQNYGILVGHYGNTGHSWIQSQRTDGNPVAYDLILQPTGGNILVGATASVAGGHTIGKAVGEGTPILAVNSSTTGLNAAIYYGVAAQGWAASASAMVVGRNSSTGRGINSGGTINANGADYAEYMIKADGCGPIAKGDVCGVDEDGNLTKSWAAAISFVVKSTDPAYVGGDNWASHIPPRPADPGKGPVLPASLTLSADATDEERFAAVAAYQAATDAYAIEKVAHDKAAAQYATDLPAWEAQLETARQCVDRIAFAGQVPVNIAGDFAVGDYLIAAANGGGIQAVAVAEKDITFEQYRRRLGKVWANRDGRPWIDVQHG